VMVKNPVGKVVHYYDKIGVSVVELNEDLSIGEKIRVLAYMGEFVQEVNSMRVLDKDVCLARKGLKVTIKMDNKVKKDDLVLREEG